MNRNTHLFNFSLPTHHHNLLVRLTEMRFPAASRHSKLLLRRPFHSRKASTLSSFSRPYSTEPQSQPEDPSQPPPPSVVTEIIGLLDNKEDETWKTDAKLNELLFSNPSPLSSHDFLHITRQLGSFHSALKFVDYYQSNSTYSETDLLSYAYQGLFELAGRESVSAQRILELLSDDGAKLKIPLNVRSAVFLIRFFGNAKLVDESMLVYNAAPSLRDVRVGNAILGVLLESGRFHDALEVLDEMLETDSNLLPDDKTKDIVFPAMLKIGRKLGDGKIVELVSKFGDRGLFPDVITLTYWITKLIKFGKGEAAWDLLHIIMTLDGPIEAPSCNALLVGLGRGGHFEKMNKFLIEMKEKNIMPSIVTFGILVNFLCKSGRVDQAIEVFQKMREGGVDGISVKPDVIIYNTLINGLCKFGRQEEGLKLMERMRSADQCAPTAATYNCLIDGFCKAGDTENAQRLFAAMSEEGVTPNIITVNTLVDGLCRIGQVGTAFEFFTKMKDKGLKGNKVTYSILTGAFCAANNINKAMEVFDEMMETCKPDAKSYYSLITGLSQAGQMDDASRVASKMKEAGFWPDMVCYNVMLSGFCKKKKKDQIYETLKEMEAAGVSPDSITYNTLISYFCKVGDLITANKTLRKMQDAGYVPTVITYGTFIHALCMIGDLEEAMIIFTDMRLKSKVPPNTVIYNTLIDAFCKNKKLEDALCLLEDMKARGVKPTTNTFNPIFEVLQQRNWLDKAFELMDQMTENACIPDVITMDYLTKWLSMEGATEKMKSFIQGDKVYTSMA